RVRRGPGGGPLGSATLRRTGGVTEEWLLADQIEFLIRAAIGAPLVELSALGGAAAGVVEDEAAEAIDEGVSAVAVLLRLPFVVAGGVVGVLDDQGAVGLGGALHHQSEAAVDVDDLVIAAVGGDQVPQRVGAVGEGPLNDRRVVGFVGALDVDRERTGDAFDFIIAREPAATAAAGRDVALLGG